MAGVKSALMCRLCDHLVMWLHRLTQRWMIICDGDIWITLIWVLGGEMVGVLWGVVGALKGHYTNHSMSVPIRLTAGRGGTSVWTPTNCAGEVGGGGDNACRCHIIRLWSYPPHMRLKRTVVPMQQCDCGAFRVWRSSVTVSAISDLNQIFIY